MNGIVVGEICETLHRLGIPDPLDINMINVSHIGNN